jgi:hypothetical protein
LKELINAPFARPGQAPAPARIRQVYERIANEAIEKKYGKNPWLTLSVCIFNGIDMGGRSLWLGARLGRSDIYPQFSRLVACPLPSSDQPTT